MARRASIWWGQAGLALVLTAVACNDEVVPTAPDPDAATENLPTAPAQAFDVNAVLSDRAHGLASEDFELTSSSFELEAGVYRFRPTGDAPDIERDDFIVAPDASGETVVRRVLTSSVEGGEIQLETGPAYWHEVIRSGTYTVTMPLGGPGGAQLTGPQSVSLHVEEEGLELPPLEATFKNVDVCQWLHDVLDLIPGAKERRVCGKEVEMEVAYGVSIAIAGTLDSLRILEGETRLTGEIDLSITVDGGSITGGRAPVFAPCNRAAYLGCLTTPTGANLIDFLRRYAPSIPDASLPPVRVCIPGTPVRTRRGYWSGFTYHPPVWEKCRITDTGALPTIVLPSLQAAANEVRPRLAGEMTIRAVGDGQFTVEVPIPSLGAKAAYKVTNDLKAEASVGIFVLVRLTLKNGGGTVKLTFDDTGRFTQTWTSQAGWEQDFALVDKSNHAELLDLTNPDSVVVRAAIPIKVKAEVCVAIVACGKTEEEGGDSDLELDILGKELIGGTGFNLGAKAGVGVSFFEEAIYTREQIHPDDPEVDNWHLSMEAGYDAFGKAGVHIPLTGWILPNVPREIEKKWECCRVSVSDYWGQGKLEVTTTTTGVDLDPDGYKVLVERADTLPVVLDEGTQRIGPGWPRLAFERSIDPDGSVMFGQVAGHLPCIAVYSDAFLIGNPVWGLSLAGARALGANIPTYAATSACRWLIARYKVTLSDVAANCVVSDGAVRDDVWLQQRRFTEPKRDDVAKLHFDVACGVAGAQGGLRVTVHPSARQPDAPPTLLLDGATAAVFEGDTVTLNRLAPGDYEVALDGLDPLCISDPVTATVVGGRVTDAAPFVVCAQYDAPAGSVTYVASMTGEGPDENGYSILVDGAPGAHLTADGSGEVGGLAASTPTVFLVSDIAGNCQPQELNPRVITLDASRTAVDVDFPVRCTAEKPDTLEGTLDASGWPATSVTLRAVDGTTLVVNGPKAGELARLTGSPVRVWGRTSATGIDVHGYDLRSRLGDDRWMGIVMSRPDGLWLLGEQAIRLVDAPAALAAESGKLVWLMGREVPDGVQPTLYGVIRGG